MDRKDLRADCPQSAIVVVRVAERVAAKLERAREERG